MSRPPPAPPDNTSEEGASTLQSPIAPKQSDEKEISSRLTDVLSTMSEERLRRAFQVGVRLAELDALVKAEMTAQRRAPPEGMARGNLPISHMHGFPDHNPVRIRNLLTRSGSMAPEEIHRALGFYEERYNTKRYLIEQRKFSNSWAERILDRQGWPRPPGWRCALRYPDSSTLRPGTLITILTAIGGLVWLFAVLSH